MPDYKQLCNELLSYLYQCDWPDGKRFYALVERTQAALAEPKPEGPTDEELLQVFDSACLSEGGMVDEIHLRGLRAVLARFGNHPGLLDSSSQPIPVSERLPGPRDSDANGRCWWYGDGEDLVSHWLPAHALPLPS